MDNYLPLSPSNMFPMNTSISFCIALFPRESTKLLCCFEIFFPSRLPLTNELSLVFALSSGLFKYSRYMVYVFSFFCHFFAYTSVVPFRIRSFRPFCYAPINWCPILFTFFHYCNIPLLLGIVTIYPDDQPKQKFYIKFIRVNLSNGRSNFSAKCRKLSGQVAPSVDLRDIIWMFIANLGVCLNDVWNRQITRKSDTNVQHVKMCWRK